jgi:multidrug efflux pump subunit AcrA (membrane-fusion protein)
MASLEVEADVSEANITRVSPEQGCEITLDAYPQQRYPGYVTKIVPTADRAKATVMVKIKFKEYDQRVLPEMSAKITFLAAGSKSEAANIQSLLTIPASAVATRNGRPVVFQIKEDRAVEVPVSTGQKLGSLIEIIGGLKEGDKVIAKADEQIRAGVKLVQKASRFSSDGSAADSSPRAVPSLPARQSRNSRPHNINLDIPEANSSHSWGRRGQARPRCST